VVHSHVQNNPTEIVREWFASRHRVEQVGVVVELVSGHVNVISTGRLMYKYVEI
jgi:hypothetical protein